MSGSFNLSVPFGTPSQVFHQGKAYNVVNGRIQVDPSDLYAMMDRGFFPSDDLVLAAIVKLTQVSTIKILAADRVLEASDVGDFLVMTSASALQVIVPTDADVPFSIGSVVNVIRGGAGSVTLVASSGVTIINRVSGLPLTLGAQYGVAQILKTAANTWLALGGLS